MPSRFPPALVAMTALLGAIATASPAPAESPADDEEGTTVLVLPFKGFKGRAVRDAVVERISEGVDVEKLSQKQARRIVRTFLSKGADAGVGGRVRCPGKRCRVQVTVFRPDASVWRKSREWARRGEVTSKAAEMAEALLTELELLGAEPEEPEEPEEARTEAEALVTSLTTAEVPAASDEPEPLEEEPPPAPAGAPRFEAVELSLVAEMTVLRNLCVDTVGAAQDDDTCVVDPPGNDDRTFAASPFGSLGGRVTLFPGAFLRDQGWWAHLGLYVGYGHSVAISSQREYETLDGETLSARIASAEQQVRAGFAGRVPVSGPRGPQLRFFAGYGLYEFSFDDADYPDEATLSAQSRETSPYLPTFSYHTVDVGADFRWPLLRGVLIPYLWAAYRLGLSLGQAAEVFGPDGWSHGAEAELGLLASVGLGFRIGAALDLLYFGSSFDGEQAGEGLWADAPAGESASDLLLRVRILVGWAY